VNPEGAKKLIAPSILSADFVRLAEEVDAVQKAGADWIHVDVMDGHFVPNITIGPPVVASLRKTTTLPLDVHLMIEHPDQYIEAFAKAGADIITVHEEACVHLHRSISLIKEYHCRAGVSLNPATSLGTIEHILNEVDLVLIMTVNPGFGGQKFLPTMLPKIKALRDRINAQGFRADIEVDGGLNADTIGEVSKAGGNVFVAGNAIFTTADYGQTIRELKKLIGE
jgi:ribulose-phosphate 3-epimerase